MKKKEIVTLALTTALLMTAHAAVSYTHLYREIGELLNISEDAAKKRGQRLVKKLQKHVAGM